MPLPQVLAGPIVRRVTGTDVSVWTALRAPAEVELTVWAVPQRSAGVGAVESGAPVVATGTVASKEFGAQLHVALVTARATIALQPGSIYSYDLRIGPGNLQTLG